MKNRILSTVSIIFFILITISACDSTQENDLLAYIEKPEVRGWSQGLAISRGHEDLTRFAVNIANKIINGDFDASIKKMSDTDKYFTPVKEGEQGLYTNHPIVLGSFRTDFPEETILSPMRKNYFEYEIEIDLIEYYKNNYNIDIADEDSHRRNLHSLREIFGDEVQSKVDAVEGAKEYIMNATVEAVISLTNGEIEKGYFWIGHAIHILQDSFAFSHTQRLPSNLKVITDVCTFKEKYENICFHPNPIKDFLQEDRIWKNNFLCSWTPIRTYNCLKDRAKAASEVGAGYLYAVAKILDDNSDIEETLIDFFEGSSEIPYSGYFTEIQ